MKPFLLTALVFTFFSCKRSNHDCRIASIEHLVGSGFKNLAYNYNANNQIDFITSENWKIQYVYQNDMISLRNYFVDNQLVITDSISYDGNGNIINYIVHRFDEAGTPNERDQANFVYQNNKIISAQSQWGVNESINADFTWTGDDITMVRMRNNSLQTDSTIIAYSNIINPFGKYGSQALLLDPGFDFIRYSNFRRLAFYLSAHTPVSGASITNGNITTDLYINMSTNGEKIMEFSIAPQDELTTYTYQCVAE